MRTLFNASLHVTFAEINPDWLSLHEYIFILFYFSFSHIAISHWSLNYKRTLLCVCQHSDNTLKIIILLGFVGRKTLKNTNVDITVAKVIKRLKVPLINVR